MLVASSFMWYRPNIWSKHYPEVPGIYVSWIVIDSSASLQKFREYLEGSNLITKLQAKHDLLQRTLGEGKCHTVNWKVFPNYTVNPLKCQRYAGKELQNLKLNCPVSIDFIFTSHSFGAVVRLHTINWFYFFNTYLLPLHRCLDKWLYLATELLNDKSHVWKESNTVQVDLRAVTNVLFLHPNNFCWLEGFFKTWERVIFLKHIELSRMHLVQWTH